MVTKIKIKWIVVWSFVLVMSRYNVGDLPPVLSWNKINTFVHIDWIELNKVTCITDCYAGGLPIEFGILTFAETHILGKLPAAMLAAKRSAVLHQN